MKIIKDKRMINEAEEPDIAIDPKSDSLTDIANTVKGAVEVATNDEKSVSDTDALAAAKEIKDTAVEVDAGAAVVVPKEDSFVIENVLTETLDDALESAELAMELGEKRGVNILVSGLPGSGKTAICEAWAKERGLVWVAMNAADSKVDAAVNGMPLRDMSKDNEDANSIVYKYSMEKLGALLDPKNAGKCVLFVDEFNRQTNQQLRRTFLSLFNEKRNADGKLDFSKNLLFTIVCINPAVKEDAGATRLNQAEKSRFLKSIVNFDSDPESSKAYFLADIANKLAKLGVDAQDAVKSLYGVDLKTKSGERRQVNKNVEKTARWDFYVERYIKILDLAMTILDSLEFEFDKEDDLRDIYIGAKQLLNQRILTDAVYDASGDAKKFLIWVDKTSDLLDKDKEMFHKILDNYFVDLLALKKAYGIGQPEPTDEPVEDDADNAEPASNEPAPQDVEDDADLFGNYNAATGAGNSTSVASPTEAESMIDQAMDDWKL